jgi:hypothetical protein
MSRCLPVRYSAEVMLRVADGGSIVTVVGSGAELVPAEFVAWACMKIVTDVPPSGIIGVKLSAQVVVDVVPLQSNGKVGSPEMPVSGGAEVYDQVTSTFSPPGSIPVAVNVTGVPETTLRGDNGT